MKYSSPKPNWFILDLLFMIYLVALFVESQTPLSQNAHMLALGFMTIGFFSLIGIWIWTNQYALEALDQKERPIRPYRISVHTTPTAPNEAETGTNKEPGHDVAA
jgi:hypothetical protein